MLEERRILLIISGGIAAFKSLDLIRRLRERGAMVTPVMTKASAEFVTPLSVSAMAGEKVFQDLFDLTSEAEMGHIELSRSADLIVVAPASADLIAKMAGGHANDLASTLLLATDTPVLVAPAMNLRMWSHAATQRNVTYLKDDSINFVGPNEGDMACGEFGLGRMAEPLEIVTAIEEYFMAMGPANALAGRRVLVTSGPTHEPIDPVRYIANRSSGAQGSAIAKALIELGADVIFVTGPADVQPPIGVHLIEVETAIQMLEAVEKEMPCDAAIFAAAVADWRVVDTPSSKIKKVNGQLPVLEFAENPDILARISNRTKTRPDLVVGFAAETEDVIENATKKRARKGCDWIVANDVSPETGIMGGSENAVTLITSQGVQGWDRMSKSAVARQLAMKIANALGRA
ncbi:bifunctional phosphopantothenoylcysteine decarboxylase/phosphopantothenate--cysteine ligase CoaBC [Paracoccaceae bacterium]|nr:bifunctional phosphopantothenoylcysteine decarboxylase/phosphopantothenate--cysteine ligase CoaBC [Paracoccaceae bacterium]